MDRIKLAAALQHFDNGDFEPLRKEFLAVSPPDMRERLDAALGQLRVKNTGKPKAKRCADGHTLAQIAAVRGYCRFHELLAKGVDPVSADAVAVNESAEFAKRSKDRRAQIYRNEDGVINAILKADGCFKENARSLFLGFEKMEVTDFGV
jgi:hypothetical protein